jgi:hypothetical protein
MFDPWAYEEKYLTTKTAESASQKALFQYCNMAANFGLNAADQMQSYIVPGYAKALLERTLESGCKTYASHNLNISLPFITKATAMQFVGLWLRQRDLRKVCRIYRFLCQSNAMELNLVIIA